MKQTSIKLRRSNSGYFVLSKHRGDNWQLPLTGLNNWYLRIMFIFTLLRNMIAEIKACKLSIDERRFLNSYHKIDLTVIKINQIFYYNKMTISYHPFAVHKRWISPWHNTIVINLHSKRRFHLYHVMHPFVPNYCINWAIFCMALQSGSVSVMQRE